MHHSAKHLHLESVCQATWQRQSNILCQQKWLVACQTDLSPSAAVQIEDKCFSSDYGGNRYFLYPAVQQLMVTITTEILPCWTGAIGCIHLRSFRQPYPDTTVWIILFTRRDWARDTQTADVALLMDLAWWVIFRYLVIANICGWKKYFNLNWLTIQLYRMMI